MKLSPNYKSKIRVASVQMALMQTSSFRDLFDRVRAFAEDAARQDADFICFPEHFTLQLLSAAEQKLSPEASIDKLTQATAQIVAEFTGLAKELNINIVCGSHATRTDAGKTENIAFLARRDGTIASQSKLHPTPDEWDVWGIKGGDNLEPIETDCGPVGIQICYDSEFPELGRRHADQGVGLVFVPYCTEARSGHLRVRYCCHARTVENQCYIVTSGLVGTIENVENCDEAYAQSAILTPSDTGFPPDGILAQAPINEENLIIADLDMTMLEKARTLGSVRNLANRRNDLYDVKWSV
ncbi:carbon-nitrogen hydrolase family protein [Ahrensia sp. 13_GOM-1096m]|uniref:carbon-nitrogen hydrolase family protein n=1 Tax=Ahrensia sp. 13_GOM-1096m TaxID=1380380 RepID=UPI000687DB4E|nr:carbon-nitrogen hydrolase family protein [Ahrensia sp. 13_GOM-1096m]